MVLNCASRRCTNTTVSVSSPEGAVLKVDVLRCYKLFRGVPGLLGHITRIQICIATHGGKRLHSAIDGAVHKSIRRNGPALPQSFELSSPSEEYGTVLRTLSCLVVRASDSRPEWLGSMPDVTKYPPSAHGFPADIVEVEIGGVAIYRPFGEFRRAKSHCHLYGAQDQRQTYF
ncbi:hypothetical protein TNCV_2695831 [Trichonephila clavipes]|nr:hypothetical protein TNCV_2695831 [Trichonephila clavipes]